MRSSGETAGVFASTGCGRLPQATASPSQVGMVVVRPLLCHSTTPRFLLPHHPRVRKPTLNPRCRGRGDPPSRRANMSAKYVYSFGGKTADGDGKMKELL